MIFTHPSQSRESILILEWGKHSLSFSVFHEKDNRVLATKVLDAYFKLYDFTQQEFSRIIKDEEIFAFTYQKVICIVDSEYLSLIPNPYFDKEKKETLLQFNFNLPSGKIRFDHTEILSTDYQAVFALPQSLIDAVDSNFSNVEYHFTNAILLNHFSKYTQLSSFFSFHLNSDFLSIFYYKNNKLLYYNAFDYLTDEDIVYHVLNVMNHLGLDNERELVYYSGSLADNSTGEALLKTYIKYLKPLERSNKLNYQSEVAAMPSHYFIHHYAECL